MKHILPILALFLAGCEGPVGPAGAPGSDGVANITTLTFGLPAGGFVGADGAYFYARPTPQITKAVVDNGTVVAYTNLGNTDAWFALPMVFPVADNAVTLSYAYEPGVLYIQFLSEDKHDYTSLFTGHVIKVAIIPPAANN